MPARREGGRSEGVRGAETQRNGTCSRVAFGHCFMELKGRERMTIRVTGGWRF